MKKILLSLILSMLTMSMMAVPAKKGLWKTLPTDDGSLVKAMLVGDEFGHYWKSLDGRCYALTDGRFKELSTTTSEVAVLKRALAQRKRTARLTKSTLKSDSRKLVKERVVNPAHFGSKKGLILLVNFKDVKFRKKHDVALYENIANTPGYTDSNGFKGSVADYFRDQSHDQFELTFDVVGPVTVSKRVKYYGENDKDGIDKRAEDLVIEAVKLAKDLVEDWRKYDWDDDGEVDQVMIIYAGEGEADGGSEDTIWPHEWELNIVEKDFEIVNGIRINTYAVANEGYESEDHFCINGIATICHEFSHCLGLNDMYDIGYSGLYGMNAWSLMDSGTYNGDGFVPCGYTSYEKYSIGWLDPIELTEAQSVSDMKALTESDDVYIIRNEAHPDEYYLLENRQQQGWDVYTPANGMLILHVDYDPDIWYYNLINSFNDGSNGYPKNDHQRCTIFHADGVDRTGVLYAKMDEMHEYYDAAYTEREADKYLDKYNALLDQYNADIIGDVYPQAGNNQLTNTSLPRAFLYNKNYDGRKLMNIAITDITQNADGTIAFNFAPDNSGEKEGDNTVYGDSPVIPDAIRTVETKDHMATRIFTLDGRYVGSDYRKLGRGLYIVGGKKLIVR